MPEEIEKFKEFCKNHNHIVLSGDGAAIEEDCATMSNTELIFKFSSIGEWPYVRCKICNKEISIGCDERAASL